MREALTSCVGKRLVSFSQAPNQGNFATGDWRDDEPLYLTFQDDTQLIISAGGWHDSGSLYIEREI